MLGNSTWMSGEMKIENLYIIRCVQFQNLEIVRICADRDALGDQIFRCGITDCDAASRIDLIAEVGLIIEARVSIIKQNVGKSCTEIIPIDLENISTYLGITPFTDGHLLGGFCISYFIEKVSNDVIAAIDLVLSGVVLHRMIEHRIYSNCVGREPNVRVPVRTLQWKT